MLFLKGKRALKYIFLKFGVRIYDYIVEVLTPLSTMPDDYSQNSKKYYKDESNHYFEILTTLGGVDTNNDGNFESGKKGVAEPFVMLVRGYGADELPYFDSIKKYLSDPITGKGFSFPDAAGNYKKPQTLWDTAVTFNQLYSVNIYGSDPKALKIGQLNPEQTGETLFKELSYWLNQVRIDTERKDAQNNVIDGPDYIPEQFYIICHSMGGPNSRVLEFKINKYLKEWKAGNQDRKTYVPFVARNVMVSPANLGSCLAKEFVTAKGKWLELYEWMGEKDVTWPASSFLTTENMSHFNIEYYPSENTFYSFLSGAGYQNGGDAGTKFRYWYTYYKLLEEEAELDHYNKPVSKEMENDAGVTVLMSRGQFTEKVWETLSKNERFKKMGRYLYQFIPKEFNYEPPMPFNHTGVINKSWALTQIWKNLNLFQPQMQSGSSVQSGSFALASSGDLSFIQGDLDDAAFSNVMEGVQPKQMLGDELKSGESSLFPFSVSNEEKWVAMAASETSGTNCHALLIDPEGIIYDGRNQGLPQGIGYVEDEGVTIYRLTSPKAGTWQLKIEATNTPEEGTRFTVQFGNNSIYMLTHNFSSGEIISGTPITFTANLTDAIGPVVNASVTAEIKDFNGLNSNNISLFDDGVHGDSQAGDGIYGNVYTGTQNPGQYAVKITASVLQSDGNASIILDQGVYTVLQPSATVIDSVLEDSAVGTATPYSGIAVKIRINNADTSIPMKIYGLLCDADGKEIARGKGETVLEGTDTIATLFFEGSDIYESRQDGTYLVKDLIVLKDGGEFVCNSDIVYTTQSYTSSEFIFTDSDNDGLSDSKEAELGTDPSLPDTDNDGLTDYQEVNRDGDPSSYTAGSDTDPLNPDTDGDEHLDGQDAFPLDPSEWSDQDGDGHGDNSDDFPEDPTQWDDPNNAPVAAITGDQIYEATSAEGAQINLSAASSTDPDEGDQIETYTWSVSSNNGSITETNFYNGALLNITLPLGEHEITLIVNDGARDSQSVSATVQVQDTTPPVLQVPADMTVNSTGVKTPVTIGQAIATDYFPVTITHNAPEEGYDIGTTDVIWTATDSNNNSSTMTQKIIVKDSSIIEVTARLVNSEGTGIVGGVVSYYNGSAWVDAGSTDSEGNTSFNVSSSITSFTVRMNFNGKTVFLNQNIQSQPIFTFQTVKVTLSLKDSQGNGISGGVVKYGKIGDYGIYTWYDMGTTDSEGKASKELLPNTGYYFSVTYDGLTKVAYQSVAADTEILFQTVKVRASLKDGQGNKLEGGEVRYYAGSTLQILGTTRVDGEITKEVFADMSFKLIMIYGGISQEKNVTATTNTEVVFQTYKATVNLKDSQGNGIPGATVKYGKVGNFGIYSWYDMGTTDSEGKASKELLPYTGYYFSVTYDGKIRAAYQSVAADTAVLFQTVKVTLSLKDSQGNKLAGGAVQYYTGSTWQTLGSTSIDGEITKEVFSNIEYKFWMGYGEIGQQQSITPTADTELVFQTYKATVNLKDSQGNGIPGATVKYGKVGNYGIYSWYDMGTTDSEGKASKELLPYAGYYFSVTYDGKIRAAYQSVAADTEILFQTVKVTLSLKDSQGNALSGGVAKYGIAGNYGVYTWYGIGITDNEGKVTQEVLPNLSHTFQMSYGGIIQQQSVTPSADTELVFQA